jgi:hypothetical protein
MRKLLYPLFAFLALACLLTPDLVLAAGGGKVDMLVVVADSRMVQSPITLYFLDIYNTNPVYFGILCVVLTAILGCTLGLTADFIMNRTGIDLTSRKLIEH